MKRYALIAATASMLDGVQQHEGCYIEQLIEVKEEGK